MANIDDQRRRGRTYFPAARFMGGLEPSPTGSYYNPARYAGQGLSKSELNRIQKNLANVYNQDVQYNRVANPRFQTEQDVGTSIGAAFGSGRATPATTQRYAQTYGRPAGNGLTTFNTPSGGSITYRPSGRQLSGGVPGGGAQPFDAVPKTSLSNAYQIGYGGAPDFVNKPSTSYERSYTMGYNAPGAVQRPTSTLGYQFGQALGGIGTLGYNAIASLFNKPQQQSQNQNYYAYNPSPVPTQPRRYFDF